MKHIKGQNFERMSMPNYDFITIIRGIAALTVALGHIIGLVPPDHPSGNFFQVPIYEKLIWPVLFGREMVWIFIFISGFSLSNSIRIDFNSSLKIRVKNFYLRRFWRIVPTYYFGLLLGLIIVFFYNNFSGNTRPPSDSLLTFGPVNSAGFLSHLLLIHNLNPNWTHQLNPPLWTIGVEFQLYFLLLPFFFKSGQKFLVPLSIVIIALIKVEMHVTNFTLFLYIEWFFAGVIFSVFFKKVSVSKSYLILPLIFIGLLAYSRLLIDIYLLYELNWLIFTILFIFFLQTVSKKYSGFGGKILNLLLKIGKYSYSLYVVHFPIGLLSWMAISYLTSVRLYQLIGIILISIPMLVIITKFCYIKIEKPSLLKLRKIS